MALFSIYISVLNISIRAITFLLGNVFIVTECQSLIRILANKFWNSWSQVWKANVMWLFLLCCPCHSWCNKCASSSSRSVQQKRIGGLMEFVLRPLHLYLMCFEIFIWTDFVPHTKCLYHTKCLHRSERSNVDLHPDMPIRVCRNFGVHLEKSYCFNFLW